MNGLKILLNIRVLIGGKTASKSFHHVRFTPYRFLFVQNMFITITGTDHVFFVQQDFYCVAPSNINFPNVPCTFVFSLSKQKSPQLPLIAFWDSPRWKAHQQTHPKHKPNTLFLPSPKWETLVPFPAPFLLLLAAFVSAGAFATSASPRARGLAGRDGGYWGICGVGSGASELFL